MMPLTSFDCGTVMAAARREERVIVLGRKRKHVGCTPPAAVVSLHGDFEICERMNDVVDAGGQISRQVTKDAQGARGVLPPAVR